MARIVTTTSFERNGKLERIQVKYTESDGAVISVKCCSHSLTNGRVRETKRYTAASIDWLAVYDRTTDRCYYIPASELGGGRRELLLRVTPAKNNQRAKIRLARDYLDLRDAAPGHRESWSQPDSNRRPSGCKPDALPTELWPPRHFRRSSRLESKERGRCLGRPRCFALRLAQVAADLAVREGIRVDVDVVRPRARDDLA
jgi:hypothetical protein